MLEGPVGGDLVISLRNGEATLRRWLRGLATSCAGETFVREQGAALLRLLTKSEVVGTWTKEHAVIRGVAFKSKKRRVVLTEYPMGEETEERIGDGIFSKSYKEVDALVEVEWEDGRGPQWYALTNRNCFKIRTNGEAVLSEFFRSRLVLSELVVVDFLAENAENGEKREVVWSEEQVKSIVGEGEGAENVEIEGELQLSRWGRTVYDYTLDFGLETKAENGTGKWSFGTRFRANSMAELTSEVICYLKFFVNSRFVCKVIGSCLRQDGWKVGEFSKGLVVELAEGKIEVSWSLRGVSIEVHDENGNTVRAKQYPNEASVKTVDIARWNCWIDLWEELCMIRLAELSC